MQRTKTQQTGSVILEALIAILIFSIGILSLIGMQATAITTVADSKYRSTAGFLADQMVGAIWSNRIVNSKSGGAASNVLAVVPDAGFCTPTACGGGTATATALTAAWVANVGATLPKATGANAPTITVVGNTVSITVNWQAPKDANPHHHTVLTFIQ